MITLVGRIAYQRNDLNVAEWHVRRCLQLTRQMESVDTFADCEVLLACLKLARGMRPARPPH